MTIDDLGFEPFEAQDTVYALAASPNVVQDGICFAGRASGLYRSEDGGRTWTFAFESLGYEEAIAATSVTVSPNFASDHTVFAGAKGGVLYSNDGGRTWYEAAFPGPMPLVSRLAVSPNYAGDGVVLAGTMEDGMFCSTDRGRLWSPWNFGLLDMNVLALVVSPDYANDETVFVGTETGLFRSANGGRAWRETGFDTNFAPVLSIVLSPDFARDGTLFAGTESNGVFYSTDRGDSWMQLTDDLIDGPINDLWICGDGIYALLDTTVAVSCDWGSTWSVWKDDLVFEQGAASMLALPGTDADPVLLIGLMRDGILRR